MNKRKVLFYTCMWLSILFFFFCSLWSHGTLFLRSFFVGDVPYCIEDTYMDFFNSIMYGLQPYEAGVIYPPLTNLFYFVVHAMIPRDIFMQGAKVIRDTQSGRMLIMIYTMASLLLLHFALAKLQKDRSENEKFLFFITVLFSAPILFAIERGNIILLALAFMILYLAYYESDNALLRHIAYISLAIAASIKIYPALLGLLLVRDKRWKDALICFIYGVLVFFLPFMFFGGINSIVLMVQNLTYFSGIIGNYFGNGWRLGIAAICDDFSIWFTGEIGALSILAAILKAVCIFGGGTILLFAKFDEKWKLYAVPILMIILFPDFSYTYGAIFMIIPLVYFLEDSSTCGIESNNKKTKIINCIYCILFLLILAPIVEKNLSILAPFANQAHPLNLSTLAESLAAFVMMIMLWGEGIANIVHRISINKQSKSNKKN